MRGKVRQEGPQIHCKWETFAKKKKKKRMSKCRRKGLETRQKN